MSWIYLIAAGLLEVAWSQSIKPTDSFTRPLPTLLCVVLGTSSVYVLTFAMRGLPVGTAYAAFTGIGAVGATVLGVLLYDDPATLGRFASLTLIIAGVLCARLTSPT